MTATSAPSRPDRSGPDPTRTGAVWVTGTGAFLLLAAASVFVAVNWGAIPDTVKLGVLLLATGGFLVAGRSLKAVAPGHRRRPASTSARSSCRSTWPPSASTPSSTGAASSSSRA